MTRYEKEIAVVALSNYAADCRRAASNIDHSDVRAKLYANAGAASGLAKIFSDILDEPSGSVQI